MNINYRRLHRFAGAHAQGFTLVEVAVASALIGMMFLALLGGLTSSVGHVQFGREQMRATQIMSEKLDTIRLYAWDDLNSTNVPPAFTETFNPDSDYTKSGGSGVIYKGTVTVGPASVTEAYGSAMREVKVMLEWRTGGRTVKRELTTFVAQYGLQNYIR